LGGPGSGRWYGWHTKDTVERCRCLAVRDWQRRGLMCSGRRFSWRWWNGDGQQVASINVQVQRGRVILSSRVRRGSEDGQDIEEPVPFLWTGCPYGGQPAWRQCPGWGCGRRVAKLYWGSRYFLCRSCHDLVYESQREDEATRLVTKAQKIRQRLGGRANLMDPFPDKPKRMHWQTYERLWWQAKEAERCQLCHLRYDADLHVRHRQVRHSLLWLTNDWGRACKQRYCSAHTHGEWLVSYEGAIFTNRPMLGTRAPVGQ
jgi:hypothetical protein